MPGHEVEVRAGAALLPQPIEIPLALQQASRARPEEDSGWPFRERGRETRLRDRYKTPGEGSLPKAYDW